MSRQSIQKIKAMLLCIEYGILFVSTVSTYSDKHSIQCIVYFDLRIDSVNINIAFNALHALIFCINSVNNPNAEFSHLIEPTQYTIALLCIDSVDKQDTILNTQ